MARTGRIFTHPELGKLHGLTRGNLFHFYNIPYGEVPQRFARARPVKELPQTCYDAAFDSTDVPAASIQPLDSAKMDCKGNQFPEDLVECYKEDQSEDCLKLKITKPESATPTSVEHAAHFRFNQLPLRCSGLFSLSRSRQPNAREQRPAHPETSLPMDPSLHRRFRRRY